MKIEAPVRTPPDWEEFYRKVYKILVNHGGAQKDMTRDFIAHALEEKHPLTEWRFSGTLGFGGKFWRQNGRVYVTCYPEDRTPAREAAIEKMNKLLKEVTPVEGVHGPPEEHERHIAQWAEILQGRG